MVSSVLRSGLVQFFALKMGNWLQLVPNLEQLQPNRLGPVLVGSVALKKLVATSFSSIFRL